MIAKIGVGEKSKRMMPWQRIVYDLGLLGALPFLVPVYAAKRGRSFGEGLARLMRILPQRLGKLPEHLPTGGERPLIWIHAVSVGEVMAARPLVERLKAESPETAIVLSTVTDTGQETAAKTPDLDGCFYLPLDLTSLCGRALEQLRPSVLVVMETELWPGLFWAAGEAEVPLLIANGRISDRSAGRYQSTAWFFRSVFEQAAAILAQSEKDRQRFIAAGALQERVHVTGNLKFDAVPAWRNDEARSLWRERLGLQPNEVLLTGGSTFAGEEELLADVYLNLKPQFPALRLLLAPRHVQRCERVEAMLRDRRLSVFRRTALDSGSPQAGDILLLDTTGELAEIYNAADMGFIGKSLTDAEKGGQNPLEPAALGVPVCFGPSMENFRAVADLLLENQAAVQVDTIAGLQSIIETWLGDPERRTKTGEQGQKIVQQQRGVTERIAEHILAYIR